MSLEKAHDVSSLSGDPVASDEPQASDVVSWQQAYADAHAYEGSLKAVLKEKTDQGERYAHVLAELMRTEVHYYTDMETLCRSFMLPLLSAATQGMESKQPWITVTDVKAVFSNLQEIASVTKQLLKQLRAQEALPLLERDIGGVFLNLADKLDLYTIYCSNDETQNVTLKSLRGSSKKFSAYLEQHSEVLRGMNFETWLIQPMQRLCRYPLLIEQAHDALEAVGSQDVAVLQRLERLQAAGRTLTHVVERVNEKLDRSAANQRLRDVEALAELPFSVTGRRRLVASLELLGHRRSGSSLRSVHWRAWTLFLLSDHLVLAEVKKGAKEGTLVCRCLINVLECVVYDLHSLIATPAALALRRELGAAASVHASAQLQAAVEEEEGGSEAALFDVECTRTGERFGFRAATLEAKAAFLEAVTHHFAEASAAAAAAAEEGSTVSASEDSDARFNDDDDDDDGADGAEGADTASPLGSEGAKSPSAAFPGVRMHDRSSVLHEWDFSSSSPVVSAAYYRTAKGASASAGTSPRQASRRLAHRDLVGANLAVVACPHCANPRHHYSWCPQACVPPGIVHVHSGLGGSRPKLVRRVKSLAKHVPTAEYTRLTELLPSARKRLEAAGFPPTFPHILGATQDPALVAMCVMRARLNPHDVLQGAMAAHDLVMTDTVVALGGDFLVAASSLKGRGGDGSHSSGGGGGGGGSGGGSGGASSMVGATGATTGSGGGTAAVAGSAGDRASAGAPSGHVLGHRGNNATRGEESTADLALTLARLKHMLDQQSISKEEYDASASAALAAASPLAEIVTGSDEAAAAVSPSTGTDPACEVSDEARVSTDDGSMGAQQGGDRTTTTTTTTTNTTTASSLSDTEAEEGALTGPDSSPRTTTVSPQASELLIVTAIASYKATKKGHLSFKRGQALEVLTKKAPTEEWGHWLAKRGSDVGYIPRDHVEDVRDMCRECGHCKFHWTHCSRVFVPAGLSPVNRGTPFVEKAKQARASVSAAEWQRYEDVKGKAKQRLRANGMSRTPCVGLVLGASQDADLGNAFIFKAHVSPDSVLCAAVACSDRVMAGVALCMGGDPNYVYDGRESLLVMAARSGSWYMINLLLEAGALPTARDLELVEDMGGDMVEMLQSAATSGSGAATEHDGPASSAALAALQSPHDDASAAKEAGDAGTSPSPLSTPRERALGVVTEALQAVVAEANMQLPEGCPPCWIRRDSEQFFHPPRGYGALYPKLVAEQMTHIESALFTAIEASELHGAAWTKEASSAPSVRALARRFNRVSAWVATEVLLAPCIGHSRTTMITFFIEVADELLALNNFNGAGEVIAALSCVPVSRLKAPWAKVPIQGMDAFEQSQSKVGPAHNFLQYRESVQLAKLVNKPCIPLLSVHLKDIFFAEEANVNGSNQEMVDQTIEALLCMREAANSYSIREDLNIVSYLRAANGLDEEVMYTISKAYQPVAGEAPPTTPLGPLVALAEDDLDSVADRIAFGKGTNVRAWHKVGKKRPSSDHSTMKVEANPLFWMMQKRRGGDGSKRGRSLSAASGSSVFGGTDDTSDDGSTSPTGMGALPRRSSGASARLLSGANRWRKGRRRRKSKSTTESKA